ncbi:MAG: rhodanese-like domain-containing protein [Bifidobacterium bifidum]
MTDKRIDSPLADDDGDAIKRITPERFAELDKSTVTLLDLREPDEVLLHGLDGAINIPFNQIGTRLSQVPNDKPVVVFCRVGDWSEQVTEILADRGYDAINLRRRIQAHRRYLASAAAAAGERRRRCRRDARTPKSRRREAPRRSHPTAAARRDIPAYACRHESKSTGAADSAALHGSNGDTDGAQPHAVFVDAKGLKCPGPIVKVADTPRRR